MASDRSPSSSRSARARGSSAWPAPPTTTGCAVTARSRWPTATASPSASASRRPDGVDAFVDTFGGYLDLALGELGVAPDRVNTIIPPEARDGIHVEGNAQGSSAAVLAELAGLVAAGELEVPIAATYPLDRVRDAYAELERRHTRGKIVLVP